MIAGIGIDLATISRIDKVFTRFGDRFAKRILNDQEWTNYKNHKNPTRFLTKRFAAKEAAVKALGTGERGGILLRDFYLEHDDLGKPILKVSGKASERCSMYGIDSFWVTLTDEGDTVAAFVVLEKS
jgi:holo-[acyl-carrier protein] synthase